MPKSYKGKFKPKNPEKYKGDSTNIIYRSLLELRVFRFCDSNDDVIWWQSEELVIRYLSPIDNKTHRYFPDIVMKVKPKKPGEKPSVKVIEIKPERQTRPPDISKKNATPTGRLSTRYIREVKTYGVNEAKWNAAKLFCEEKGWDFLIMTEKDIGALGN